MVEYIDSNGDGLPNPGSLPSKQKGNENYFDPPCNLLKVVPKLPISDINEICLNIQNISEVSETAITADQKEVNNPKSIRNVFQYLTLLNKRMIPSEFNYSSFQGKEHMGEDTVHNNKHVSQKGNSHFNHTAKLEIEIPKLQISDINEKFLNTHGINEDNGIQIIEELEETIGMHDHDSINNIFESLNILAVSLPSSDFKYIPVERKEFMREDIDHKINHVDYRENTNIAQPKKLMVVLSKLLANDINKNFLITHGINIDSGTRIIKELTDLTEVYNNEIMRNIFEKLYISAQNSHQSEFDPLASYAQGMAGIALSLKFTKINHFLKAWMEPSSLTNQKPTNKFTGILDCISQCQQIDFFTKILSTKKSFEQHQGTHTGEKPYKCIQCNKSVSHNGILIKHLGMHTGEKPYQVSYCDKCFASKGYNEKSIKLNNEGKPYQCSKCYKSFNRKGSLKIHWNKIHDGEQLYKFKQSKKCFSMKSNHNNHEKTHSRVSIIKCSFCGKRFLRLNQLKIHHRKHTGEKPYKCNHCVKSFISKKSLKCHIMTHMTQTIGSYSRY